MVCFTALALSELIVYWIGEIMPPRPGDRPPAADPSNQPDHRPQATGRRCHRACRAAAGTRPTRGCRLWLTSTR